MRKVSLSHRIRRKIRSHDSAYHPKDKRYKWFVLFNIMLGTFMAVLDSTIVNVGLPKIMASFGVGLDKIQWVVTAYMLAMAVTLPTSAWLADRFGYKRVYFLGLFFFTIGSLFCGLSENENVLILSRIIQGFGAGTIQPLGMAIITREFPLKQRGVALGFWAIAAAASISFGPLIGGYLVDNFSWQLIFTVNIPIGLCAMLFTVLIQREYINKNVKVFDYVGFASITVFVPLLLYALSEGNAATNSEGWHAPYILFCLAVSAIAFAVFLTRELTTKYPLIDLRLLKDFNFGMTNIIMMIFSMGMFGSTFLLPLYLQNSLGYSALQAGAVFLPVGIIQGIMSPISGSLTNKVDARITMCFGILLLVFSFYLNSNLSILTEHHYIMTALYLRGFSMGLIFTQMSTLSMLTIPRDKMAQASSISNTVRQIGGSLGVAILTTVLATRVNFHTQIFGNAIQSSSQQFSSVMGNLVTNMQSVGGSPHAAALKQAQSILLSNVSKQAYIQGIDDDFLIAAVITLLAIVPTIFLQTKQKKQSKHRAMNVKNVKIACMIFAVGSVIPAASAQIQTASDSLSLKSIIDQVIVNYPSIKKNEQDLNAANANIGLAKSTYYPNIEVTSSFARIGPTSTMTIPTLGSFSFYPANNYSAAVNLNQVIYDFGKTAQNISVENQNKELVKMSNEQLKQKLSSSVVSIYYAIAFLQEAIKIENEQLATLNEHLAFVQKKMSTGSTTSYEILTTKVKISNIENQKTDLQTTLRVQTCQLNTLLGQSGGTSLKVKPELLAVQPLDATDNTLLENAFNNREEVKLAQEKIQVSEMHIKTVHAQNNPVLNFSAAGGIKNGYIPNLNEGTMNYSVGVGLKIPIYDATRTKYNLRKTNSEIESNKQDLDLTKRAIENEVVDCEADVRSALKKIDQTSLQLKQADQAYNLALTSYKSGTITNLDLLDSSTSLSEAKLSVLKANIDYSLSFYKLKIATGEKIY